jgi:hypothetical protein
VSDQVKTFHGFKFVSQYPQPGYKLFPNSTTNVTATVMNPSNRTLSCTWSVSNPPIIKLGGAQAVLRNGTYTTSTWVQAIFFAYTRVAWISGVLDRGTLVGRDSINASIRNWENKTKYGSSISLSRLALNRTVYFRRPVNIYLGNYELLLSVRIRKKVSVSYSVYGWVGLPF